MTRFRARGQLTCKWNEVCLSTGPVWSLSGSLCSISGAFKGRSSPKTATHNYVHPSCDEQNNKPPGELNFSYLQMFSLWFCHFNIMLHLKNSHNHKCAPRCQVAAEWTWATVCNHHQWSINRWNILLLIVRPAASRNRSVPTASFLLECIGQHLQVRCPQTSHRPLTSGKIWVTNYICYFVFSIQLL